MTRQFDFLKRLVKPNLTTLLLGIVFGGILWFMPEMFGSYDFSEKIDVMFMKQFVLWSYPLYLARIIGFVVTVGICLWLMKLCEKLQVLPVRSAMPVIIGLTISGTITYTQPFDENLFVIILFIFALQQLINMYHFEKQVVSGFNIIVLLSIAALFEPHYVWLALLFVLGMIIFRIVKERVFWSILLGIITVSVLLTSVFWLVNELDVLNEYLKRIVDVAFITEINMRKSDIIGSAFIILIILFSLISCMTSNRNFKLNVRLNFTFISWCFWISIVWVLLFMSNDVQIIAIPSLFAVLCLSLYFTANHNKTSNILFIIYTIAVISYRVVWCLGL